MRFTVKFLAAAIAAGLFCSTLTAVESGFVAKFGVGSSSMKTKISIDGYGSAEDSDRAGTFEIYGGYRMQNAQFGLSYANINCDGCDANYILASGAYVFEGHDIVKPYIGAGLGLFSYKETDFLDENGLFGTVNLGVNAELEHFFVGLEFRQRIFGEAKGDTKYLGHDINVKVEPKQTFLFNVGYKF
ncbi:MAG: porin family protein [Campylobacteraceae bacterium]|jgi:hypothetical protein|nr:porin family protein [Campylobacteraceae bacterium]